MIFTLNNFVYIHMLCRNELITSTWLENSDDRPTFFMIVQKLSGICNLTKPTDVKDTWSTGDY